MLLPLSQYDNKCPGGGDPVCRSGGPGPESVWPSPPWPSPEGDAVTGRKGGAASVTFCVFSVQSLQALLPQYIYFWRITITSLTPQASYLSAPFFLVYVEVCCVLTPLLLSLLLFSKRYSSGKHCVFTHFFSKRDFRVRTLC